MPLSPRTLRPSSSFTPRSISGLALWLDASATGDLYTTDAGPVVPVNDPRDITGCALWLDASDSSTITHTGGAVSEWRDKTTNGRHYTASTTARPSTGIRTQNGLNVIDFDGVNHQMSGNAATLSMFRNVSSGHVFVVAKMDTTAANPFIFSSSTAVAGHLGRAQVFVDGSGNLSIGGRRLDADGFQYVTVPSVPTVPTVLSAHFDWASSDLFFRRDGAVVSSLTTFQTDGATSDTNSLASSLGGAGAGFRLDGYIAEIIVFNTAITAAQRASVEAYLAAKWGISGVHRSATQEIAAVGAPTELAGCVGWWDASSVSGTNGTPVQSLADLSANNGTATASGTSSNWPTIGSGLNGKNTIVFDGTRNGFRGNFASSQTTYAHSVFVVCKLTGAQSSNARLFSAAAASGNDYDAGNVIPCTVNSSNSDQLWQYPLNGPVSGFSGTWGIFAGTMSPSGVSATSYRNGSAGTTVTSASTTQTVSVSRFGIACDAQAGASKSVCEIAEVIYFNTALSTTDRARVEKYLAAKWGIANVPDPTPPVGYWRDRSGNGRHATQATGANRPIIHSSTQNNRRVLSFDGSNDVFLGTGAQALKDGMTVVGAYASGNVNFASLFAVGDSAAGKRWVSGSSSSRIGADFYTNAVTAAADSRNRTDINAFTFSTASNSIGVRINGAQALSQSSLSPALAAFASNTFAVGGVPAANEQWWSGRIFELAVYNRVLSASECRRIEQALAAKWGIVLAPQVSNADAQDWINRVYANGGTVTSSTAAAVNQFCNDIDSAGIRDRFYRLGIFAGTGLNACLVPLYRGPSLGGTQYGNATDTNVGPFVSGDYVETGASGGLWYGGVGNNTSKRLDTGIAGSVLSPGDRHLSAYEIVNATTDYSPSVLSGTALTTMHGIGNWTTITGYRYRTHNTIGGQAAATSSPGFWLGSDTSSTASLLYRHGSQVGSTSGQPAGGSGNSNYQILGHSSGEYSEARLGGYSIGLSMSAGQVSSFHAAMQAFQAALGRNV